MTQDEATILMIRWAIASLPAAEAEACNDFAEHIRRSVKLAGDVVGPLAVALVGAEMQAGS